MATILATACLLCLSACTAVSVIEEAEVVSRLAPMDKPGMSPDTRVFELDTLSGNERHFDILTLDNSGVFTGKNLEGCEWSSTDDHVSPALTWKDCSIDSEWTSGKNTELQKSGELWPLEVGKRVSYSFFIFNAKG